METTTFLAIGIGILIGVIIVCILKSFKLPEERKITTITKLGKFHTYIMSIEGYRRNKPGKNYVTEFTDEKGEMKKADVWDIIPKDENYKPSKSERTNIYFFLYPFYKTFNYEFGYTKTKKIGEEQEGDVKIWEDTKTGEVVVARKNISNYIDWKVEYPTITGNLFTSEMGKVIIFTNNVIRVINPMKMMFRINNWFGITTETIGAALKGIVGNISIDDLNKIQSEGTQHRENYIKAMEEVNTGIGTYPGVTEAYGIELEKSAYKAFLPADKDCEDLIDSFIKPKIAEKEGEANVNKAKKDAEAYNLEQEPIVRWKKKYLVDTGLAKTDQEGNITELLPDANTRVSTDAIKELSKIKGTLVLDSTSINKMLNLNNGGEK